MLFTITARDAREACENYDHDLEIQLTGSCDDCGIFESQIVD